MLLIACFACNSGKNYDKMAKELCACMQPLADLNVKLQQAQSTNDQATMQQLFDEVERVANQSGDCANDLEKKYGLVDGDDEQKATEAMKKACPEIAAIVEQSRRMNEEQ